MAEVEMETKRKETDKHADKICATKDQSPHVQRKHTWVTDEFLSMVKERNKLHIRMKADPRNLDLRKQFILKRNQTATLRRNLKLADQKTNKTDLQTSLQNTSKVQDKLISTYRMKKPWITPELMESIAKRDELRSRVRKMSESSEVYKTYSSLRNKTAKLRKRLKSAYQRYLEEL